jgi:hypothetical protein
MHHDAIHGILEIKEEVPGAGEVTLQDWVGPSDAIEGYVTDRGCWSLISLLLLHLLLELRCGKSVSRTNISLRRASAEACAAALIEVAEAISSGTSEVDDAGEHIFTILIPKHCYII